jgi:glycosyltransferase involved in cell wall biosynthesis
MSHDIDDPIHVAIDLTPLRPEQTGVDRYLKELVIHLGMIDRRNDYTVFLNIADRHVLDGELPPNFRIRACCLRPRPVRFVFQQAVLPAACATLGVDVVHSPSFVMPYCRGRQRHLLTIHDMTFFTVPHLHSRLRRSAAFRSLIAASIRRAHMINVPSRATRDALLQWRPSLPREKVRVTEYGVSSCFRPAPAEDVIKETRRLRLPESYFLYVGTIEPRKNVKTLIDSYRRVLVADRPTAHLVLAGKPGLGYEPLMAQMAAIPELQGRVHVLGFVSEDDLPWVYRGACLFVYPSLLEGFGFPPLEAMACGVPVVSTVGSALEENLRDAAELVPPEDSVALAMAIRRLMDDHALRAQRRRLGFQCVARFRWENTARHVLACYQHLARSGRQAT